MTATREIPIFPLGTVLFPGGLLPLRLFEQRYLEMAKTCLRDAAPFGVCLIREGAEVGAPATPEPVGCLARIAHWDMQQLGLLQIVAQGASAAECDAAQQSAAKSVAEAIDFARQSAYPNAADALKHVFV